MIKLSRKLLPTKHELIGKMCNFRLKYESCRDIKSCLINCVNSSVLHLTYALDYASVITTSAAAKVSTIIAKLAKAEVKTVVE